MGKWRGTGSVPPGLNCLEGREGRVVWRAGRPVERDEGIVAWEYPGLGGGCAVLDGGRGGVGNARRHACVSGSWPWWEDGRRGWGKGGGRFLSWVFTWRVLMEARKGVCLLWGLGGGNAARV